MKKTSIKIRKNLAVLTAAVVMVTVLLSCGFIQAEENKPLTGAENVQVSEIYKGVKLTTFELPEDSKYGLNKVNIVEFNPNQSDLYIDVTNMAEYSNQLKSVMKTVEDFNANNNKGKTAIAAVNGDLWMVGYAHARVEGSKTEYGGYKDAVVTKVLTVPRGFNMYDGEIITSSHMQQETPFEGEFQSFGFTADNKPYLGQPKVTVKVTNITQNIENKKIDGINRLPANNAVVMYTDKGALSNYSLANAYEIVIDCDYDYVVKHDAKIKGKITAICKEGDENPSMQANRIILTARGKSAIGRISDFKIGDEIEISVSVTDAYKNNEVWQNDIVNAVGGHMVFAHNGKYISIGDATKYPTTIIAETNSGNVMLIQNDGRQPGYSAGIKISDYEKMARELDLKNAFIVDGGGSSTLVALSESGYKLVNRPSDKDSNGDYGKPRTVVNSIIVSYGADRNAPTDPTQTEAPTDAPATVTPDSDSVDKGVKKNNKVLSSLLIVGSVVCLAVAIILAVRAANKKYGK